MMRILSPKHNGKIIWLASYPKSGNTWFRSFLCALFTGHVNLNNLDTHGIFSSRTIFDEIHDLDSSLLGSEEVYNAYPKIFEYHAIRMNQPLFIKIHDSLHKNSKGEFIVPANVTHKVIYLVRNPLDIVASFANHNAVSIDRTIFMMNHKKFTLANQKINTAKQFPQFLQDWSSHVNSWINQKHVDTVIVKYEDMKANPFDTFSNTLKSIGFTHSPKQIREAIELTMFDKLKNAETKSGFREKNIKSNSFFRKGQVGGWKNELTKSQAEEIYTTHKVTMAELGFEMK